MKHTLQLSPREKIRIWLDLSDFSFRLMSAALGEEQLEERLGRMREEDLRGHRNFLTRLGELNR